VILKEKNGDRQFPIIIGFMEVSSIKMKLSGHQFPRPMTHDLTVSIIHELGGQMEKMVIDKLIENTFHAKLVIKTADGKTKLIDTRPSDGIALSVRANAPIFVEEEVLKKASILNV